MLNNKEYPEEEDDMAVKRESRGEAGELSSPKEAEFQKDGQPFAELESYKTENDGAREWQETVAQGTTVGI